MGGYQKLQKKYQPSQPYCYLAVLGVSPEFHGTGVARILMDEVHAIDSKDELSTGVYLETAKETNAEMYRHMGYELVAKDRLDGKVDTWYMFRSGN